jgi:GNAT superfamily N-acetyltransferase
MNALTSHAILQSVRDTAIRFAGSEEGGKEFIPAHGHALQEMDCEEVPSGNGLVYMSLLGFFQRYGEELEDYFDEDFGSGVVEDIVEGGSMILCLVDNGKDHLPEEIKKKIRKAGKFRRDKLKHQWSYVNPLNRIHGYANLVHVKQQNNFIPEEKKVLSISVICASHFSKKKGIGSDLMKMSEEFAKLSGYTDIILEVANEYAGYAEEESDDESEEEEDESAEEEEEEEQLIPDESVIDILADEFWKKCVRKDKGGNVSYNIEKEYLESCLWSYLYYDSEQYMDKEKIDEKKEPGEYEYGGFWYNKGKLSKIRLMRFYERMGYKEEPSVHTEWNCFSEIPYPSMRLELH